MSSNIEVQRICQHCGKEFTARKTVTRYCSHRCNSAANKARIKAAKVEVSNKETQRIKIVPIEKLKAKEFLTVRDTATLLNSSLRTVYRLIKQGNIKAANLAQRKTLVKRSEIDKMFKEPNQPKFEGILETQELNEWIQSEQFDISECYNLTEVQSKYGISEGALQQLIKRHQIPKIKKGWFTYVPKSVIDKLLS